MSADELRGAPKRRLNAEDSAVASQAPMDAPMDASPQGVQTAGQQAQDRVQPEAHGNGEAGASNPTAAAAAAAAAAGEQLSPAHQKPKHQSQHQQRHQQGAGQDAEPGPSSTGGEGEGEGEDAAMQDLGTTVDPEKIERLLKKAETVLAHRTDRILLVLERPLITDNYLGCLRTAECMGVHNVWVVVQQRGYHKTEAPAPGSKQELKEFRKRVRLSRQSAQWLDMREFATTTECVAALKAEGWTTWVTDLSPGAVSLTDRDALLKAGVPKKLAIVMGREADGVTEEMRAASEKRVFLPLVGFNTSLNLQVATGMVLQQLLGLCPEAQGDLSEERKAAVRKDWYTKLARNEAQKSAFLAFLDNPPAPHADMALIS